MQKIMKAAWRRKAAIACVISAMLMLCATPALALEGPSGTTADVPLKGTVKDRPVGTISVTMPSTVPFNVELTPDGRFSSLNSTPASIENLSQDAAVSAKVTKITDASALLSKVKIFLNTQPLVAGENLNLDLGQAEAATSAGASGKLALTLSGQAMDGDPAISSGAYDVVSTITLSRVPRP